MRSRILFFVIVYVQARNVPESIINRVPKFINLGGFCFDWTRIVNLGDIHKGVPSGFHAFFGLDGGRTGFPITRAGISRKLYATFIRN